MVVGKKPLRLRSRPVGLHHLFPQAGLKITVCNKRLEFIAWFPQEALCCKAATIGVMVAIQKTWEVMLCQVERFEIFNPSKPCTMVVEEQLISARSAIRTSCVLCVFSRISRLLHPG